MGLCVQSVHLLHTERERLENRKMRRSLELFTERLSDKNSCNSEESQLFLFSQAAEFYPCLYKKRRRSTCGLFGPFFPGVSYAISEFKESDWSSFYFFNIIYFEETQLWFLSG